MAKVRLTRRAAADLAEIAAYTIAQFGIAQARRHRDAFEQEFSGLLARPRRGRPVDWLAPGLRRVRVGSHAVFYRPDERGILIVRILHARMDAPRHPMADN